MKQRIGLIGGSFNPAHAGHLHISLEALRALGLHQIWWLVSPQNPLKSTQDMAAFETRFSHAQRIASHEPRIVVSDFETTHHLQYSVDTVAALQHRHPKIQFFWIMGADNLVQFHRWRRWQSIARMIPILVMDRAPFSHSAMRSKAAIWLKYRQVSLKKLGKNSQVKPPIWAYGFVRRHPQSATALRLALGKNTFLKDN